MSSCSKSEGSVAPVEVDEKVSSEYYVAGYAMVSTTDTDSSWFPLGYKGLSGVTVNVGGQSVVTDIYGYYSVKFDAAQTNLTVAFSKSDYITISKSASFASDAAAGSTIIVSQMMSKYAEAADLSLTVTNNEVTTGSEAITLAITSEATSVDAEPDATSVSMTIPASTTMDTSAVYGTTTDISIAVTPYTPSTTSTVVAEAAASESTTASTETTGVVQAFNCSPSGLTFDTPVTLSIATSDSSYAFTEMKHLKENEDGTWEELTGDDNEATLAADGKSYDVKMTSFSNHALSVDFDLATSVSTSTTSVGTVDNLNTTSTKTETLAYNATDGCELVGLYLGSSKLSEGSAGYSAAYELYSVALTELGKIAGTSNVALSTTITAAGDTSVAVSLKQTVVTYTFTANVSGILSTTVKVILKRYGSTSLSTSVTYGDMRADHNY